MRLGFIGTGEITSAIVTGLCSAGTNHPIWLSPRNSSTANELSDRFHQVAVAPSNQAVVDGCDTVVIAVRPAVAQKALSDLRFRPDHRVISLVAALSLPRLVELVAPAVRITRAVPLPSAAHRLSPTAIYPPDVQVSELFATLGTVCSVETERQLDAVATASATIATYYAFTDTIASWLEHHGIPASQSRDYVARLFLGVATGAVEASGRDFQSLAAAHATPGGLNEQVLKHLVERGILTGLSQALDTVLQRIVGES